MEEVDSDDESLFFEAYYSDIEGSQLEDALSEEGGEDSDIEDSRSEDALSQEEDEDSDIEGSRSKDSLSGPEGKDSDIEDRRSEGPSREEDEDSDIEDRETMVRLERDSEKEEDEDNCMNEEGDREGARKQAEEGGIDFESSEVVRLDDHDEDWRLLQAELRRVAMRVKEDMREAIDSDDESLYFEA